MRNSGIIVMIVGLLVLFPLVISSLAGPMEDLDEFYSRRPDIPENISRWSGKTDKIWILREWIKITTERNDDFQTARTILGAIEKSPSPSAPPTGGKAPAQGSETPVPPGKPQDGFPPDPDPGSNNVPGTSEVGGEDFGTLSINGSPSDRPADGHPDLNLAIPGWSSTESTRGLVDMGGDTDGKAPKFKTMFEDNRVPEFPAVYRVNGWNWDSMKREGPLTNWEVTLLGMKTNPGEVLRVPTSGYDIGEGKMALVLYAAPGRITLKYTREDNVVGGYTLHVEGVAIDGRLQALYDKCVGEGRGRMPALRGGQGFGRAAGSEVKVAIRDTGTLMDPRVRKDWW